MTNLAQDRDNRQALGDTSVKIGAQIVGNPRLSQKLSAYQEGLCSMDLDSIANVSQSFCPLLKT